jgi:hypothetical protein
VRHFEFLEPIPRAASFFMGCLSFLAFESFAYAGFVLQPTAEFADLAGAPAAPNSVILQEVFVGIAVDAAVVEAEDLFGIGEFAPTDHSFVGLFDGGGELIKNALNTGRYLPLIPPF